MLEGEIPASALFADLSKAFERINAYWILHILHIRQSSSWALQLAKYLLLRKEGCYPREKSSPVLTWDDPPLSFSSVWQWIQFLLR